MKRTLKSVFVLIGLLFVMNARVLAYYAGTINVAPNSLSYHIGRMALNFTELKLIGSINGNDIETLRQLVNLEKLDLSAVNIVKGGGYYATYYAPVKTSVEDNKIPPQMFNVFQKLKTLILPDSIVYIGDGALKNCKALSVIQIPRMVTTIGVEVFKSCMALSELQLPKSMTGIGWGSFDGCSVLKNITFYEQDPNLCFHDGILFNKDTTQLLICVDRSIIRYEIPSTVISVSQQAFAKLDSLELITFPDGIKVISSSCFDGCKKLKSIKLSSGLETIGNDAFSRCTGLVSILLPYTVKDIGFFAFESCTSLREIHCQAIQPPTTWSTFTGVDTAKCRLIVPIGTMEAYKSTIEWGRFPKITEEVVSVKNLEWLNLVLSCETEGIVLKGVPFGERVDVYTATGLLLKSVRSVNEVVKVDLPSHQMYIIKTIGRSFKVIL